MLKSVEKIFT